MSTHLEQTLRRALAEQAATLPPDASAKLLAGGYRPRSSTARAVFAFVAAPLVAVAAVAVLFVEAGTDAPRAFAGWSAAPTAGTAKQVSRADATCRSQLNTIFRRHADEAAARPTPWAPFLHVSGGSWRVVLADTRGAYTMIVLEARNGQAVATCFADRHSEVSLGLGIRARPPAPVPPGRVSFTSSGSTTTPSDEGSHQFSQVVGRTGAGVAGVAIRLNNGTRVTATCANGWFLAWWPGSHGLTATEVRTAAGIKAQ